MSECPNCEKLWEEVLRLKKELSRVADKIDDILYDPSGKPVDDNGNLVQGDESYLLNRPVQECHMPALREWFVNFNRNHQDDRVDYE